MSSESLGGRFGAAWARHSESCLQAGSAKCLPRPRLAF